MSCTEREWSIIKEGQSLGDYWYQRCKQTEKMLHNRENYLRTAFAMLHKLNTQHEIEKTKQIWNCTKCHFEFMETSIEQLTLWMAFN